MSLNMAEIHQVSNLRSEPVINKLVYNTNIPFLVIPSED